MIKLFDYTNWTILEVYEFDSSHYVIQVRMNKRTGFKKFKVSKITKHFTCCHKNITPEMIELAIRKGEGK